MQSPRPAQALLRMTRGLRRVKRERATPRLRLSWMTTRTNVFSARAVNPPGGPKLTGWAETVPGTPRISTLRRSKNSQDLFHPKTVRTSRLREVFDADLCKDTKKFQTPRYMGLNTGEFASATYKLHPRSQYFSSRTQKIRL